MLASYTPLVLLKTRIQLTLYNVYLSTGEMISNCCCTGCRVSRFVYKRFSIELLCGIWEGVNTVHEISTGNTCVLEQHPQSNYLVIVICIS